MIVSLVVYQAVPSVYAVIGIVFAIGGSTLMVYADEKRGEAGADITDRCHHRSHTRSGVASELACRK